MAGFESEITPDLGRMHESTGLCFFVDSVFRVANLGPLGGLCCAHFGPWRWREELPLLGVGVEMPTAKARYLLHAAVSRVDECYSSFLRPLSSQLVGSPPVGTRVE